MQLLHGRPSQCARALFLSDMRGAVLTHKSCQQAQRYLVAGPVKQQLQQHRPGLCQGSKQQAACTVSVDPLEPV
jgi:hypothetical protein